MVTIEKGMRVGEILQLKPQAKKVLEKYGLCPGAAPEKIDYFASVHLLNLDTLLKELNES